MWKKMIKKVPGVSKFARAFRLIPKQTGGRCFLLEMLPKNSVGAEIGVHVGDFSQRILEIVSPRELHITGDDYTEGGWWEGGVKKAVDEFARAEIAHLVEIRNDQFVLRKKP